MAAIEAGKPTDVNKAQAGQTETRKANRSPAKSIERSWQECPDRNWAAEFGYGGKASIGQTKDILQKMRSSFKSIGGDDGDDDDPASSNKDYDSGVGGEVGGEDDDPDLVYRSRGFKGTVKASPAKAPRILSVSSLRTRMRLDALMRRAREFMRKDKRSRIKDLKAKKVSQVEKPKKPEGNKKTKEPVDRDQPKSSDETKQQRKSQRNRKPSPKVLEKETTARQGKESAHQTTRGGRKKISAKDATADDANKSDKVQKQLDSRDDRVPPVDEELAEHGQTPTVKQAASNNATTTTTTSQEKSDPVKTVPKITLRTSFGKKHATIVTPNQDNDNVTTLDLPATGGAGGGGGLLPPEAAINIHDPYALDEDLDEVEDDDFDGIIDDDDDDETDGLLIPLENGWVCEKRFDPETESYSTHFWSPDGVRHSSLTVIKQYGSKKKLKLNMAVFEKALKTNPSSPGK